MSQTQRLAPAYLLNYTTIHLSYLLFPTVLGIVLQHTWVANAVSIRSGASDPCERSHQHPRTPVRCVYVRLGYALPVQNVSGGLEDQETTAV